MRRPILPALALLLAVLATSLLAPRSYAQDWGMVPNISSTMGVNAGRICYGESSRGDLGCPADAPTITGSTISGTFVGNGSGLTGVIAAGSDRITSGTAQMIANGNTNSISITESGVTTGYYYGGNWVAGGVSTTGMISSTNLFVSGSAGIGRPGISSSALTLGGSLRLYPNPTHAASGILSYDTNGFIGTDAGTSLRSGNGKYYGDIFSSSNYYSVGYYGHTIGTGPFPNANSVGLAYNQFSLGPSLNGYHQKLLSFTGTVTGSGLVTATGLYTAIGDSTTNSNTIIGVYADVTSGTNVNASRYAALLIGGNVGIGTISPKATLEVSGTVSATNFVGNGSGLTGISTVSDRLTSGTSVATLSPNGTLTVRGLIDLVTGTSNVGLGQNAAKNNTGNYVTAIGYGAGQNNSVDGLTATGYGAGGSNSGTYVTVYGGSAAQLNTGNNLTAVGGNAATNNKGNYVTALGYASGQNNSAVGLTATGYGAGASNSGTYVTANGYSAGQYNTGLLATAIGLGVAQYNTGDSLSALGAYAAQSNTGSYVTAVGVSAAGVNSALNLTAIGAYAARYNSAANVTALGYNAVSGVSNTFSNVTGLGYNAQPNKSNQIVLGDGNIVEVSTTGVYLGKGVSTTGLVTATALNLADNPTITCGPASYGTMKFISGRPYFCRP